MTYEEACAAHSWQVSDRFARLLREHGVERGDRVAMLLPSTPETAAAFLGTWKAGAILLSMSILYGDEGIRHRLDDSQARVVVTNAANRSRVEGLADVVELAPGDLDDGDTDFERVDT